MEMGRRDVKRGGSNKQSSGSGLPAKSKKGMLKKLRLTDGKLKQEMMMMMDYEFSHPSDLENEVSKKKSKFPKKNLKDTNGVDHASVPRKLRSAMKKRNLESVTKLSSVSKKLNRSKTGIESFKKDLVKKENQEMEAKATVAESMMISKDEKEVAETLYGLAGMFTEADSIVNKTCDEKETSKVDSIFLVEADSTKTESLEPEVSVLSSAKTKLIDDKQLSSTGLKQSSSVNVTDLPAIAIETKVTTSDMDYKSNGLALWPGLSSRSSSSFKAIFYTASTLDGSSCFNFQDPFNLE
ncbi:hypothetical protein V5N11_001806 [Cardamine amara subsp. amara]|uniref:Uncharacterized protein n=1 Tax=Cardamine amara subsp. amara TaxID=228776 RepID=A0ABD1AII5_CARAN